MLWVDPNNKGRASGVAGKAHLFVFVFRDVKLSAEKAREFDGAGGERQNN